ncbi:846_t:CDS:2, partial [Gigaspora margarita]
KSSGKPKCPKCGLHFRDIKGHLWRIHHIRLENIMIQRPEISNSRRDENHHALVIRNVNSQQENPANHTDSNQETPTLNCRND